MFHKSFQHMHNVLKNIAYHSQFPSQNSVPTTTSNNADDLMGFSKTHFLMTQVLDQHQQKYDTHFRNNWYNIHQQHSLHKTTPLYPYFQYLNGHLKWNNDVTSYAMNWLTMTELQF